MEPAYLRHVKGKKLYLGQPNCPTTEELKHFEVLKNPTAAILLFWENSNLGVNPDLFNIDYLEKVSTLSLLSSSSTSSLSSASSCHLKPDFNAPSSDNTYYNCDSNEANVRLDRLKQELSGLAVTSNDAEIIINKFNKMIQLSKPLYTCGACGVRDISKSYYDVNIIEDLDILQLTEAEVQSYLNLNEYKDIKSVYLHKGNKKYYHLHPEFVSNCGVTKLCQPCNKLLGNRVKEHNKKRPSFSLANNYDYGNINRLPEKMKLLQLTFIEELLICPVRLYGSFLKLNCDSRDRCIILEHTICFFHEGPEGFISGLDRIYPSMENLEDCKIVFVGVRNELERTRAHAMMNIHGCTVRPQLCIQWLKMHKVRPFFLRLQF